MAQRYRTRQRCPGHHVHPASLELVSRRWGEAGPQLLLLHGLGDGSFVWNAFLRPLAHLSCVAVDLRGHGDSPWDPHGDYRPAAHVADVLNVIRRMRLTDFTLMGHSLGADIAIHVAAKESARIRRLILVDGGPDLDHRAALALRQQMHVLPRRFGSIEQFEQALAARHPLANPDVLREYARCALRYTPDDDFALKFDAAVLPTGAAPDPAPLRDALRSVQCPKLIVRGAVSSFLSRPRAVQLCDSLENCTLATVPRAGHSVALDNPSGLRDAVTLFLSAASPSLRA